MRKPILSAVVFAVFLLAVRVTSQETPKEQSAKPLAGYTVLVVERFKVEPTAVKAGFVEAQAPVMQSENGKQQLLLSGTVTDFEPGSQAERYLVGFGAGAAKLRMHCVFQDAATG